MENTAFAAEISVTDGKNLDVATETVVVCRRILKSLPVANKRLWLGDDRGLIFEF